MITSNLIQGWNDAYQACKQVKPHHNKQVIGMPILRKKRFKDNCLRLKSVTTEDAYIERCLSKYRAHYYSLKFIAGFLFSFGGPLLQGTNINLHLLLSFK